MRSIQSQINSPPCQQALNRTGTGQAGMKQNSKFRTRLGHPTSDIWNLSGFRDLGFGFYLHISFLALLFSVMIVAPCFSQPPLKVGALIPFTGRWGDSGRECAKGMLDAGKWINQRGGIYGRKLEILPVDDTSQVAETMAAYRKLNEADHVLLLYIYSTDTALSLLRHIQFDKIPTMVSVLPSPLSDPSKYPLLFSILPTPLDLAKIAMNFISEKSEIKVRKPKMAFIGSPDQGGQHFLEGVKTYAGSEGFDIGPYIRISDFSNSEDITSKSAPSPLERIIQYNADFTYLTLTPGEASFILQEANRRSLKTKWICNTKAFDENLVTFDGVFGVQPVAPFGEDIPGMVGVKEAHQRWHPYDSHTLSYVEGWATTQVIAEALGRSLPEYKLSRERVKVSLESFRDFVIGGLVPPITITARDHRPSVESRIFIIKDGKLVRYTSYISLKR
jgi:branched-chain amino acid transport system substrate-binding protein